MIGVYVRVSTVGQNEAGQRAEIERWLRGNAIDASTVRWFVDKGKSGDTLRRPAFERLQAAVFAGEIGTIVTYKLDRLSRSLRDGINTLAGWCEQGIRVVATSQQLDFNGSVGQMVAAVLFAVAQMEQETRRERQRAGIEAARERGVYRGRRLGTTKNNPARAIHLRRKGLTDPEIAQALGISRRTVQRYLRAAGRRWGGSTRGRRIKVSDEQLETVRRLRGECAPIAAIARATGLSRPTVYRLLANG